MSDNQGSCTPQREEFSKQEIDDIGDYAFANNEIEIVSLPTSILNVGKFAFANNNISSVNKKLFYDSEISRRIFNKIKDLEDKLLREKAELINYRRRKDEEVTRLLKFCNEDLIKQVKDFESMRIKLKDTFGKSGKAEELMKYFGIISDDIVELF